MERKKVVICSETMISIHEFYMNMSHTFVQKAWHTMKAKLINSLVFSIFIRSAFALYSVNW